MKSIPDTNHKPVQRIAVECGACHGSGSMGWLPCWMCHGQSAVLVDSWPSTFTRNTAQLERFQPVVFSACPGMPMTPDRYHLLSESDDPEDCLTKEEMAAGWHYCYEFDGLLIGPGMDELEYCRCRS